MNIIEQHRAITHYRAAFHDMPVAGPMDGAAYGEYLKSKGLGMVIGVVAAVAAVATGGATLAAWATASTAQLISAGAMVAGGVMSGVGAVTGNQKLMKIGGVLSLAGGLGGAAFGTAFSKGLVSGVNAAGEGAAAVGSTATAGLEAGTEAAGEVAAEGGKVAADSTAATLSLSDQLSAAGITPAAEAAPLDQAALATTLQENAQPGIINNVADTAASGTGATGSTAAVQPAEAGAISGKAPVPQASEGGVLKLNPDAAPTSTAKVAAAPAPSESGGLLSSAGKFFKDNKEMVEIAGKTLQGVGSEGQAGNKNLQAANANQANATADATKQAMDLKAQQAANANAQVIMLDPRDPQYAQKKAAAEAAGRKTVDMPGVGQSGPVTMAGVNYANTTNQWAAQPNSNINIPRSQRQ